MARIREYAGSHYRQEVEIVYNFIGAVEIPDFLDDDEYDGLSY